MTTSKDRFNVDYAGWAKTNAQRPLEHLIREVISNALDADDVRNVTVSINGTVVVVEDDAPEGIKSIDNLVTIFSSSSAGNSNKRGRKGRGIKEFIAVATSAEVDTVGFKVHFEEGRREEVSDRKVGTRVVGLFADVTPDTMANTLGYLRSIIPPHGVSLTINDVEVARQEPVAAFTSSEVPSIDEDGVNTHGRMVVELTLPADGESAKIYELGIPIEKINFSHNINCHGKIPLNDERTQVSTGTYPQILNEVFMYCPSMLTEQMLDNFPAIESFYYLTAEDDSPIVTRMHEIFGVTREDHGRYLINDMGSCTDEDEMDAITKLGVGLIDVPKPLRKWFINSGFMLATDRIRELRNNTTQVFVPNDAIDPGGRFETMIKHAVLHFGGGRVSLKFVKSVGLLSSGVYDVSTDCDLVKIRVDDKVDYSNVASAGAQRVLARILSVKCDIKIQDGNLQQYVLANAEFIKSLAKPSKRK